MQVKHVPAMVAVVLLLASPGAHSQDVVGTSFGIPNSSPGVFWPRGSSVETLGFGRLYPNGPEFGLGNTSGGFGVTGSGRLSGVGLAERSLPTFVQVEIERPYANIQRLKSAFTAENARLSSLFNTVLGTQFRSQTRIGTTSASVDSSSERALASPGSWTGIDSVLHDRPATSDTVLHTGL